MISYRQNVALILRRTDGRILLCERSDHPGTWQFPQGGVIPGESLEEALARETLEEISLTPADYSVIEHRGPYRYEFEAGRTKEGFGGQEQTYFLAEFLGDEALILTQPSAAEFRAAQWIFPAQFPLKWTAPIKRPVYRAVFRDFFGLELDHEGGA